MGSATPGKSAEPVAREEPWLLRALALAIVMINRIGLGLSAAAVLISMVLIGWSVVMRYVFNAAPVWVDETIGMLLVAIVSLATADVLRRGGHIGVDIITNQLKGQAKRIAAVWSCVCVILTALILVFNGWHTAMFSRMLGVVTEGYLEFPLYWLMLFVPLMGLMLLLTACETLLRLLLDFPVASAASHQPIEDAE